MTITKAEICYQLGFFSKRTNRPYTHKLSAYFDEELLKKLNLEPKAFKNCKTFDAIQTKIIQDELCLKKSNG